MIAKRFLLCLAVAAGIGLSDGGRAPAQTYPNHALRIVVPYPAGGPTDTLARILADHMRTSLGQTLIIVG